MKKVLRGAYLRISLAFVFVTMGLTLVHYISFKTLDALRAYTNGESFYSKGQKDASRHLLAYLLIRNPEFKQKFYKSISIPLGDAKARMALQNNQHIDSARVGFLQGMNHHDDIEGMIWLFENFEHVSFMAEAITYWTHGDSVVQEMIVLADEVFQQDSISKTQIAVYQNKLELLTQLLSKKERAFTHVLGVAARVLNQYLFVINLLFTLIVLVIMIWVLFRIILYQRKRNRELQTINTDLDNFSHILTHDLREPLNSMEGLMELLVLSEDKEEMKNFGQMLKESVQLQKKYIQDVVEFFRFSTNIDKVLPKQEVSFYNQVHAIFNQIKHLPKAKGIVFETDFQNNFKLEINAGLKVILSNLISNAIKYSDDEKPERKIEVKAAVLENELELIVADNGIGMDNSTRERLFSKFFTNGTNPDGIGLGLFITFQTIKKLKGNLEVHSKPRKGTVFTIRIPIKKK